ncbi:hypothetical protein [Lentzea sp. NPDC003310]|uniref:hypothetical protein n=1 Tax=Lentzea sp. NPDC003310 TaxID=3154447 RepID=UPI0033A4A7B3
MTEARPTSRVKQLLLASAAIAVPTVTGFLSSTRQVGLVVGLGFLSMVALAAWVIALGRLRPSTERWMIVPELLVFVGSLFPAAIGGHSVWLSVFGETAHCRVDTVERHPSTRGSDSFTAGLRCGDRMLELAPTKAQGVKPVGTELDVVVDRTGFFTNLERDEVSGWRNVLFLVGLLISAGFLALVALLPVRRPESTERQAAQGKPRRGGSST